MSVAVALLLQAAVPAAAVPPAFAGMPEVTTLQYDVAGRDAAEVRRAIDHVRPTDANDGTRVDAFTTFAVRSAWPTRAGGACDLSRATATLTATVLLPRLTGDVPPALRARWDRYRAALEAHEAEHVRRVRARMPALEAALRGATCETAKAAGQAVLASIREEGIAYDAATDHGRREGAVFP